MADWISDTVKRVYQSAKGKGFGAYGEVFAPSDWPANLQKPTTPGQSAYPDSLDVTAYRITGTDPGFRSHPPQDVPQAAITANRRSFIDGLNLFFPDDAIADYTRAKLAQPALDNLIGDFASQYAEDIIAKLPRPHALTKLKRGEDENNSFRASLEHDFTTASMINEPINTGSRRKYNRHVLGNDELYFSYAYSRHHPELWIGFLVWQNIMEQYAHEIVMLHYSDGNIGEQVKSPQSRFINFVKNSVAENITFQTFFIPHIVQLALQRKSLFNNPVLGAKDIKDGIAQAKINGIFRREFDSSFGTRRIICPFDGHGTRWLTQDLKGSGKPEDTSMVLCYKQVLEEKENNSQVKAFCSAVSDSLAKIVEEHETLPAIIEAALHPLPVRSNPNASGMEPASKCPFHQSLG